MEKTMKAPSGTTYRIWVEGGHVSGEILRGREDTLPIDYLNQVNPLDVVCVQGVVNSLLGVVSSYNVEPTKSFVFAHHGSCGDCRNLNI